MDENLKIHRGCIVPDWYDGVSNDPIDPDSSSSVANAVVNLQILVGSLIFRVIELEKNADQNKCHK